MATKPLLRNANWEMYRIQFGSNKKFPAPLVPSLPYPAQLSVNRRQNNAKNSKAIVAFGEIIHREG